MIRYKMKDKIIFYIKTFISIFCELSWVGAALCALISTLVFMLNGIVVFWWLFVPLEVMNIFKAIYEVVTIKESPYKENRHI